MKTSALLGGLSPEQFLRDHWQKKPLLVRQALPGFDGIVDGKAFLRLAGRAGVSSRLVIQHPGRKQRWERHDGPFAGISEKTLPSTPWTILIHGVESLVPGGWELLRKFDFIPSARVDDLMMSYAGDGGGVGPHDDRYDVFLLQGPGKRRWQISYQTEKQLDPGAAIKVLRDFRADEEWLLEPGDMLYLPPGVAHFGVAEGRCFTYSIGFLAPSHAELRDGFLAYLAGRAGDDIYADPDLQVQKDPLQLGDAMVARVADVLAGIRWDAADVEDFLGRFLTRPKPHHRFVPPARPMAIDAFAARMAGRGRLQLALPTRGLVRGKSVFVNGQAHHVPRPMLREASELLRERSLPLPRRDLAAELFHDWYLAGWWLWSDGPMKAPNALLAASGTTIFEAMSALAREHAAVNLGQGFPDDPGPLAVRQAAADYLLHGHNQYPPMMGLPALRQAVAAHHQRFYDLAIDWQSEVLVTSGATEALLDCFMALLEPGDEVVLLEPAYDTYAPVVRRLGAVPRAVRLVPPGWSLPREALEAAFSPRTKALVLNTPMNPTGKVFSREELHVLAELCVRHDAYAICDEVYEHLVFAGARHLPLLSMPGMRERCLRIGSAGKTFSLTGWKVGYVSGPAALVKPVAKAHQYTTFTTPPNLQHAVAQGLGSDDAFFAGLGASLARSRDRLADGLRALGLPLLRSEGTYFLVADVAGWMTPDEDDVAFCRRLVLEAGVVLIPMSAFYAADAPRSLVRFCFSKVDSTLDGALSRLREWRARMER